MKFDLSDFQQRGTQRTIHANGEIGNLDNKIIRMRIRESNRKWIAKKIFNVGIWIGVGFILIAHFLSNR